MMFIRLCVHYILVLTAIYTIISSCKYIQRHSIHPGSHPVPNDCRRWWTGPSEENHSSFFFCPPVCCSSTSLCHLSTSLRCDGSFVDVSCTIPRIRMTVYRPFHHNTVKNPHGAAYQLHLSIGPPIRTYIKAIHWDCKCHIAYMTGCLYCMMDGEYPRLSCNISDWIRDFSLLYRKGRKVYFWYGAVAVWQGFYSLFACVWFVHASLLSLIGCVQKQVIRLSLCSSFH